MTIVVRPSASWSSASSTGALGLDVERAGRLVEDEHRRVAQDRAGDRDALLLAAGEAEAALADDGVVALRQRGDQLVDLRGAGGVLDLRVGRVGAREAQVLADRRVEQVGLLGDDADRRRRATRRSASRTSMPSIARAPLLGLVQARDEVAERRLARAGLADDRDLRCRRLDVEVDVAQRPVRPRRSGTRRRRSARSPRRARERRCVAGLDVTGRSRYSKMRSNRAQRGLHVDADRQQRLIGQKQARLQRGEGDDRADRDRARASEPGEPGRRAPA